METFKIGDTVYNVRLVRTSAGSPYATVERIVKVLVGELLFVKTRTVFPGCPGRKLKWMASSCEKHIG